MPLKIRDLPRVSPRAPMLPLMRFRGILVTAMLVSVTACSSGSSPHQIDRAQWKHDLSEAGIDPNAVNWRKLETVFRTEICTDKDFSMLIAVGKDSGTDPAETRASIKNVCPDRLGDFDKAANDVADAGAEADTACSTPPDLRSEAQRQIAEALDC